MRKWRNLSASADPNAYFDLDGFWPTKRGSYETSDFLTGSSATATGASQPSYAFAAKTVASSREFVVDAAKIWEFSAGTYTDRTNGVAVGANPYMAQYGNITVCAMGSGNPTVVSTATTFAALAGAPKAEIALTQSNCLLLFNTDSSADGWAASDVGDYTNFATGEAASGRLLATPGPITAAVPFGNDVIVFKGNSIYRMWYEGGLVKWASQLLWSGLGCVGTLNPTETKYYAAAGGAGILFVGGRRDELFDGGGGGFVVKISSTIYLFDGASPPRLVNPETMIQEGRVNYDPQADRFSLYSNVTKNAVAFYCPFTDMWGQSAAPLTSGPVTFCAPVMGNYDAKTPLSTMPVAYSFESANLLKRYSPGSVPGANPGTCYLQLAMIGQVDRKTLFDRVTPIVRKRIDFLSSSRTLTVPFYRELDGTAGIATQTVAMSSARQRFDFTGVDNFARPKVTWVNFSVEVDDLMVRTKPAGED